MTPQFVSRLPNIPELWRSLTPFTFLRLLLPDVVPGYRRILYLDCDIRIDGPVAPLFKLDMRGCTIAAVDGFGTYYRPIHSKRLESDQARMGQLGFDTTDPYFNAGVLLIDCDQWRRDGMTDAAMDCIKQFGLSLTSYDQDVLNIIFRKAWVPLSSRWNFPSQLMETKIESILAPVVYHNLLKPWVFGLASRREVAHFKAALNATPYQDFLQGPPPYRQVKYIMETRAKELMQYATFFLPSSYQRLKHRSPRRIQRVVAEHLIGNVRSRRFADVDQGMSAINVSALSSLLTT
jgi:lipopolysaccharide biosynthesis glycosyltransferase